MKNIRHSLILLLLTAVSCQDQIDIDLETSQERLVIEALIEWKKGTSGSEQMVRISKTTPFYLTQTPPPPATGASVTVTHENGTQYTFLETENGIYTTNTFLPEIGAKYVLQVIYENETYLATETLFSVPDIDQITQGTSTENPRFNFSFTDEPNTENYYYSLINKTRVDSGGMAIDESSSSSIQSDEFAEGNQIKVFYDDKDILPGDIFEISHYAVSERYFNYIEIVDEQSNSGGFGPFTTSTPTNIRGNFINTSDTDNYAYGFFKLSEVNKEVYIYQ